MIRPCVRCGFCCKQGSCQFGQYDFEKKQCEFLIQIDSDTYRCGRYEFIVESPPEARADFSPAFGAGCCSPINTDRQGKIVRLR